MNNLDKIFHLKENHTDVKTEVIAGVTTFMTMAYILAVNPSIMSAAGMDSGAIFTATALASMIATLCMAAFSNYPFVLAPGMGLNAYFAYTVVINMGYSWEMALAAVFIEGLIFIVLSLTKVRESIFNAIPVCLKNAVSAGIGLFIAFIGLQNAKLTVNSDSTLVTIFSMSGSLKNGTFRSQGITALLALIGVLIIGVLMVKKVKGNILLGIFITWGLGILCQFAGLYVPDPANGFYSLLPDFSSGFGIPSLAPTFLKMDFSKVFSGEFLVVIFAFLFVDMFDTLGTLYGACRSGDLLVKNDKGELEVPNMNKAMMADAIATCTGSVLGTSTVTTFVESSAGVAAGGKTGITSLVTSAAFAVALFFAPLAKLIPAYAYGAALIYVGVLMIGSVKDIDWKNVSVSVPAFLTIAMMPFTYNISYGIAFGLLSYVVIKAFCGEIKEIKIGTWVITALFIAMFFLTH